MLATIYANLNCEKSTSELIELYKEYYKNEYFVRILDEGKLPETKFVAGSNFIDIGLVVDKRLTGLSSSLPLTIWAKVLQVKPSRFSIYCSGFPSTEV